MEPSPRQPPLDEQELLLYKHKRLAERVNEQRSHIRELETRVEGFEKQQEDYRDTLSCVNRLWTSLNDDIVLLIQRTVGDGDAAAAAVAIPSSTTNGAADSADDPFLHALLHPKDVTSTNPHITKLINDATNHQRAASDAYSGVEASLRTRMATTNAAMAKLLEVLTTARDKLGTGYKDGTNAAAYQDRVDVLQRQVDAQQGLARAVNNHIKLLQDELEKDKLTIRQLESELADKTEALVVVKRKLEHYRKHAAPGGATVADSMAVDGTGNAVNATAVNALKESGPTESGELPGSVMATDAMVVNSQQYQQLERDHAALAAEVEGLRKLLEERAVNAEDVAQEVGQLKRELEHCKQVLALESNVLSSKQYMALHAKHERVGAELHQARQALDGMRHEVAQERGLREAAEAKALAHASSTVGNEGLQKHIGELEQRIAQLEAESHRLQLALHQKETAGGNPSTVQEMIQVCDGLHKENVMLKENAQRQQHVASRLAEAAHVKAEVDALVQAKEDERAAVAAQLQHIQQERDTLEDKQHAAQACIQELEAFIKILLEFTDMDPDTTSSQVTHATLTQQLTTLQQQLKATQEQRDQAQAALEGVLTEEDARKMRAVAEEQQQECRVLRAEVAGLTEHLKKMEADAEAYMAEIEAIGSAFDSMSSQNGRLLDGVTRRDEEFNKLTADNITLEHKVKELTSQWEQQRSLCGHLTAQIATHDQVMGELQGALQRVMAEAAGAREAAREAGVQCEAAMVKARQWEDENATLQEQLQAVKDQCETTKRALDEEGRQVIKERNKRQKLEEENKVLQGKVTRLKTVVGADDAAAELQEELQMYRSLLRCSVCSENRKDTIITKCYHMFCSSCIQRNLDTRHRKCPGCNIAFGQGDVKSIYFS